MFQIVLKKYFVIKTKFKTSNVLTNNYDMLKTNFFFSMAKIKKNMNKYIYVL